MLEGKSQRLEVSTDSDPCLVLPSHVTCPMMHYKLLGFSQTWQLHLTNSDIITYLTELKLSF
jgi:hypothetical protein